MIPCSCRTAPLWGAIALAALWNAVWDSAPAIAQSIIPAPDELSTQVQSQGNTFEITGGQVSGDGASLFHSFSEFNLNQGETAQFLTPANTQSVLGRIVGGNPSFVDGTIQLLGSQADLYLLNPAGLVFGQNATLDVPGVFLGSTATGIGFEDAGGTVQWFNVFAPAAAQTFGGSPSLLRFEVEIPGNIANFGNLTVGPGEQIWLVGGNVLQAGSLTAPAGTIALTAVEGNQLARFAPAMPFSLSAVPISTSLQQLAPSAPPTAPAPFSPLDLPALLTGAEGLYPASQVTINDQGQVLLQGEAISGDRGVFAINDPLAPAAAIGLSAANGHSREVAIADSEPTVSLSLSTNLRERLSAVEGASQFAEFDLFEGTSNTVEVRDLAAIAALAGALELSASNIGSTEATTDITGTLGQLGERFGTDFGSVNPLRLRRSTMAGTDANSILAIGSTALSAPGENNATRTRQSLSDRLDDLTAAELVGSIEQLRAAEYGSHWGVTYQVPVVESSVDSIQTVLQAIAQNPGKRAAVIYAFINGDDLELTLVLPNGAPQRQTLRNVAPALVNANRQLRQSITSPIREARLYRDPAKALYQGLLSSFRETLDNQKIELLMFSLDSGLRSLPIAALHDGEQYLIENYAVAIIPSFGLLETDYKPLTDAKVLVAGASQFQDLGDLSAVPVELAAIQQNWPTVSLTESQFTLDAMQTIRQEAPFTIAHLATHAVFRDGDPSNSFVQLWGDERLTLDAIASLNFHRPPLELLVLSACQTAFGNDSAELGFAGLSVQSGAKSVVASLWRVSDTETLALMSEFYDQLGSISTKAEALRQAQLAMLRNETTAVKDFFSSGDRSALTDNFPVESEFSDDQNFSHPYFWSGFTLVGSPW